MIFADAQPGPSSTYAAMFVILLSKPCASSSTAPCSTGNMPAIDDLPANAVGHIIRYAQTRHIPGTNRYARVCRRWRDAAADSKDQEQLQVLLALEGLPADTVAFTSQWLEQHGECVKSLCITYDTATAPLFQQLPLSTAPLVGLVRLEVDGPDSLVALAPALPQLGGLTHLRAGIGVTCVTFTSFICEPGVFSAGGELLDAVPRLQQLCPGLRSLRLDLKYQGDHMDERVDVPLAYLLPRSLQELHIVKGSSYTNLGVPCAAPTAFTSLRRLALSDMHVVDPDLLLGMPGLEELEVKMPVAHCWVQEDLVSCEEWLTSGLCTAQQHLTKLTGLCLEENRALHPVLTRVTNLRTLNLWLGGLLARGDPVAVVQQLSVFSSLKQLDLAIDCRQHPTPSPAVLALSSLQQLTHLRLHTWVSGVVTASVPRSTWAAVLPHLTQLRVLAVDKKQLLELGLVQELSRLCQLQCLYVEENVEGDWDPAATGAEVAAHLDLLSQCSSLRAVLCSAWPRPDDLEHTSAPTLWEYQHGGLLHLSCWYGWHEAGQEGRVMCPRAAPHLPGVWELQEVATGLGSN